MVIITILIKNGVFGMFKRVSLLLCAFAFLFLAACAGSKGGSSSYDYDDDGGGGGGGGGRRGSSNGERVPRADELKEARNEAVSLTEENHKMSREIFELKNKLGLPTDE
jgi:hypothetical protein